MTLSGDDGMRPMTAPNADGLSSGKRSTTSNKKKIVITGGTQANINERKNRAHLINVAEGS
jgi:hypothetical protein